MNQNNTLTRDKLQRCQTQRSDIDNTDTTAEIMQTYDLLKFAIARSNGIAILPSNFVNNIVHWYDSYLTIAATPNLTATSSAPSKSTLMPKCRGFKMASLKIISLLKHNKL